MRTLLKRYDNRMRSRTYRIQNCSICTFRYPTKSLNVTEETLQRKFIFFIILICKT